MADLTPLIESFLALPTTNSAAIQWLEKYFNASSLREDILEKLRRKNISLCEKGFRVKDGGVSFDFYFYHTKTKKETPPRSMFVRGKVPTSTPKPITSQTPLLDSPNLH